MIAGSAKKDLGAVASITVPSVIIGAGHVIARLSDVPCIVIPCGTPVGEFAVEVNISRCRPPARGRPRGPPGGVTPWRTTS
jgi:CheY-specific phosphatase CheX